MSQAQLPRSTTSEMNINEMYKIATRSNTAWGIDGYQVPKHYFDSNKNLKDREIEELLKKGKPIPVNKRYITKRGNFLDDELKQRPSQKVSPATYMMTDGWKQMEEEAKKRPKINPTKRDTYIELIYREQKKRPTPAPNLYQHPVKSEKQIKEEIDKIAIGDLPNYLNEYQYQSAQVPGPGNYNDRQWNLDMKLGKNIFDKQQPNEWIKKHKEIEKKKSKKDDLKAIDPIHVDYETFDKTMYETKSKPIDKNTKNLKYFGSQDRFRDMKKTKSTSYMNTPGAGQYNLLAIWWGKDGKKQKELQNDDKKKQYDYSKIHKGIQKSIYY